MIVDVSVFYYTHGSKFKPRITLGTRKETHTIYFPYILFAVVLDLVASCGKRWKTAIRINFVWGKFHV